VTYRLSAVGANLFPDAEITAKGTPMDKRTPRIRTMDALGLLVLRHHESGCRTRSAADGRRL